MTLLAKPTVLPRWATVPGVDALSAQPNVVEPPSAKKDTGFHYKEKPPRNWWNWIQNLNFNWLGFLDEQRAAGQADYNFNSFETVPGVLAPGGLFVDVTGPVDMWLNGTKRTKAAQSGIAVADNSTVWIYLDSDAAYKSTTIAATASAPNRVLVAKAITLAGAITSLISCARKRSHATHVITVSTSGESDFTDLRRAVIHAGTLIDQTVNARVEIKINGDYNPGTEIVIDQPVTISGDGLGSRVFWTFTAGAPFRLEPGAQRARIRGLNFKYVGGAIGANHAAIRAVGATLLDRVSVEECTFDGCMRGVFGSAATVANRWHVSRNEFFMQSTSTEACVEINATCAAADWTIDGNDFEGPVTASASDALRMDNAGRTNVHGNSFDGFNRAVLLSNDCGASIINGNIIDQADTHGIECDSPGVVIAGNQLRNCGNAAGVQGGAIRLPTTAALRCSIVGNFIHDWQKGFAISCAAGHALVNDNVCEQVSGTATAPAISGGIAVQDDYCNVQNNWIDLLVSAGAGTGGKVNCYGIKCGLYGSGPGTAFTANGAEVCNIQDNMIRHLGGSGLASGAVGIDAGRRSNVSGNTIENILGVCIDISESDTAVHGNTFFDYGLGPLVGPLAVFGVGIFFQAAADRCNVANNMGRGASTVTTYPMYFDTGCVDCKLRGNLIQAGSAAVQFPPNLHLQDYGSWEWIPTTTTDATVTNLGPALAFAPNEAYYVRTFIRARRDAVNACGYDVQAIISTDGAGVPTIRTQATTQLETDQNLNCVHAIVGSTLVVQVTGAGGQTWVWRGSSTTEKTRLENTFYT